VAGLCARVVRGRLLTGGLCARVVRGHLLGGLLLRGWLLCRGLL
jgi:hypothetical protein